MGKKFTCKKDESNPSLISSSTKNLKIFNGNHKPLSQSSQHKFKFTFDFNNNNNFSDIQKFSFSALSEESDHLHNNINYPLNRSIAYINNYDSKNDLKSSIHTNTINPKNSRLFNKKDLKKKQFQCEYCLSYYSRKDSLKFHIFQVHSGYKGIPCKYCNHEFKRIKDHERLCKFKTKKKTDVESNKSPNENIFNKNNLSLNEISLDDKFYINGNICLKEDNKIKKSFCINIGNFKYFTNNIIGSGGNMLFIMEKIIKLIIMWLLK